MWQHPGMKCALPLLLALAACSTPPVPKASGDELYEPDIEDTVDTATPEEPGAPEPVPDVYRDADGDGYGDPETRQPGPPVDGEVEDGTDCDDTDPEVHPGAQEVCSGHDEDCDGLIDDADDSLDLTTGTEFAMDADGDGHGSPTDTVWACVLDTGMATSTDDCNDTDPAVHPGAVGDDRLLRDLDCVPDGALSDADVQILGDDEVYVTGTAVGSAGDIDGDGLDDIIVGAPLADDAGSWSGKAVVVLSGSLSRGTRLLLDDADIVLLGVSADDRAGDGVAGAGDVDGDGLHDVIVGAPEAESARAGAAYVVLGSTMAAGGTTSLADADVRLTGANAGDSAGDTVALAGDVDGDGRADVLVSAHERAFTADAPGHVHLMLGASLATDSTIDLADADHTFAGDTGSDHAGSTVAGAGDVDGDGLDDILIGVPFAQDPGHSAGAAALFYAASLSPTGVSSISDADVRFFGENRDSARTDFAGSAASGAGDVDGDGRADLLIGAPSNDDGRQHSGKAYVVLASSLGSDAIFYLEDADHAFRGDGDEAGAGQAVSGPGDMDGDGLADVVVGAPYETWSMGRVYVFRGATLATGSPAWVFDADIVMDGATGSQAGGALSGAGDVDGDGRADLLIGAVGWDGGAGRQSGAALLLLTGP